MTFVVPYDGTQLSKTALITARLYSITFEDSPNEITKLLLGDKPMEVTAICIIPESARYAREKGWIGMDEDFAPRSVAENLHREVTDLTPNANFQFKRVGGGATSGTISSRLRKTAHELEASVMFIGSENAGRIITPLSSVGSVIAADKAFDIHLTRKPIPQEKMRKLSARIFK